MWLQDELTRILVKSCKLKSIKHSLGLLFASTVASVWDTQQTKATSEHLKHCSLA